jgi:hypothetical protein
MALVIRAVTDWQRWAALFSTMRLILFNTAIAFELFYVLMFVLTIRLPSFRFWPPPSHRSWQFFASWLIASLVAVNFLFIGLLDFDSFFLHHWLRFPIALLHCCCSSSVAELDSGHSALWDCTAQLAWEMNWSRKALIDTLAIHNILETA